MPDRMPSPPWSPGYCREHFLADVINAHDLRAVAELGVWKGRTFLHLACHCPHTLVYGIDAWAYHPERAGIPGGETYAEWDMAGLERHVREAAKPFQNRALIIKADTVLAARNFRPRCLDLIFVDADHSAAGVERDLDAWVPKVRRGGFVTGHDIDWPTVRAVVAARFPDYHTGPDNVWWVRLPA